ncbi:MAG TPA: UDP-N-acetylglucosamine 2-epimerase (non-hydrolyzing) [Candidatus Andersenbacteria bacterium]|nr:UDP-N-acetylglucosamine 2-epimerase (non-hydrolyzing) [Candidatus Andersenbacteria bacterium]
MNICFILGTRPEAIKLFPVVKEFIRRVHHVIVLDTQQQKGAVQEYLCRFIRDVRYDCLSLPRIDGNLSSQFASQICEVETYLKRNKFDLCVVHGDTNSTLIGAQAAFYSKTPILHVEAGLRSGSTASPFPEEINRQLVSKLATFHAAPTDQCQTNLLAEGVVRENITVTGNTVIDAIALIKAEEGGERCQKLLRNGLNILVACHRRENRDVALSLLCSDMKTAQNSQINYLVMLHPNPNVNSIYEVGLKNCSNVTFVEPLGYRDFVILLNNVDGVITDSGGIQEEVTYLNKPTLIFRSETERPEVLDAQYVELCNDFPYNPTSQLLSIISSSAKSVSPSTLLGNGLASAKIADFIECRL